LPSRKRANTSLEKEKREKQKFSKMKKSVMGKTMKKENKKDVSLKAGYNQHASLFSSTPTFSSGKPEPLISVKHSLAR